MNERCLSLWVLAIAILATAGCTAGDDAIGTETRAARTVRPSTFDQARDNHDACYQHGWEYDIDLETCDLTFLADAEEACSRYQRGRDWQLPGSTWSMCVEMAGTIYAEITVDGDRKYHVDPFHNIYRERLECAVQTVGDIFTLAVPDTYCTAPAVTFNGGDGIASGHINATITAHTWEVWINPNGSNEYGDIVTLNNWPDNACGQGTYLRIRDGGTIWYHVDPAGCGGTNSANVFASVTPGVWTHLAGTYDGSVARLYVNGQLRGQASGQITPSQYINFGGAHENSCGQAPCTPFSGAIGEVRLWTRALSAAEIAADQTREGSVSCAPGLYGWWDFSENGGSVLGDRAGGAGPLTLSGDLIWSDDGAREPTCKAGQPDADGDGVLDWCDNCPKPNACQEDVGGDGIGDACQQCPTDGATCDDKDGTGNWCLDACDEQCTQLAARYEFVATGYNIQYLFGLGEHMGAALRTYRWEVDPRFSGAVVATLTDHFPDALAALGPDGDVPRICGGPASADFSQPDTPIDSPATAAAFGANTWREQQLLYNHGRTIPTDESWIRRWDKQDTEVSPPGDPNSGWFATRAEFEDCLTVPDGFCDVACGNCSYVLPETVCGGVLGDSNPSEGTWRYPDANHPDYWADDNAYFVCRDILGMPPKWFSPARATDPFSEPITRPAGGLCLSSTFCGLLGLDACYPGFPFTSCGVGSDWSTVCRSADAPLHEPIFSGKYGHNSNTDFDAALSAFHQCTWGQTWSYQSACSLCGTTTGLITRPGDSTPRHTVQDPCGATTNRATPQAWGGAGCEGQGCDFDCNSGGPDCGVRNIVHPYCMGDPNQFMVWGM